MTTTPIEFFELAKKALNLPKDLQYTSAYQFGTAADDLAQLVFDGEKKATTSALKLYQVDDDKIPEAGGYDIILDSKDNPICVTLTDEVITKAYRDINEDDAFREGEGDKSLAYWRKEHDKFFAEEFEEYGLEFRPKIDWVVFEKFHVVFKVDENK